jgi:hypothetical protein
MQESGGRTPKERAQEVVDHLQSMIERTEKTITRSRRLLSGERLAGKGDGRRRDLQHKR